MDVSTEVASAYVSLIPSYRGGTAEISRQLGGSAEGAGRQAGTSYGRGLTGGLSAIKSQVTSIVSGLVIYKGLGAAAGFAKSAIFGFNSTLEQSTIAFTTMLGSGKKAEDFIGQLKDFAKSTPFDFEGLVQNSQTLLGMGISAKDIIPDLTALGDSVASVGGDANTLNNTILAFAQTSAKGTVDMGNLNQLLQGGVPTALKVLAEGFGVTTGEMVKMISTGKVQSSVALPMLIKGLEKGTKSTAALGGMMDKQSQTFSGALSNIGDSLTQSVSSAFLPFFQATSRGLQTFAGFLSGPTFSNASKALTGALSDGMAKAGDILASLEPVAKRVFQQVLVPAFRTAQEVIPHVVTAFRNLWATAQPLVSTIAVGLVGGFRIALAIIRQLGPVLSSATGFLRDHKTIVGALVVGIGAAVLVWKAWQLGVAAWSAVTRIAAGVQLAFNAVMAANPILLVVAAIAALAVGLIYAYNKSATFRKIVQAAFNGVKAAALVIARVFTKDIPHAFMAVVNGLHTAWNAVVSFFKTWGPRALMFLAPFIGIPLYIFTHFKKIIGWLGSVWSSVLSGARNMVSNVFNAVTGLPGKLAGLAGKMLSAGRKFIGGLFNGLKDALGKAASFAADIGKSIANGIIGFINRNVIDPVKGFKVTVGAFGIHHTFQPFGSLPDIPELAKGGIIPATPGGRLVRVAEAGQAEAVIPLDKLGALTGGRGAPLVGSMTINEVSDTVGTARAVTRRLAHLGAS